MLQPFPAGMAGALHLGLETLAFVAGFRYFLFLRRRQTDPIPESNRLWIIIAAAVGALLVSRLLGALEDPSAWLAAENMWLYLYANKTLVGGLLGGLFFVEGMKKILGERSSSGDLFTYPLILAIIIGRIGCFAAGLSEATYGSASDLPWAIDLGDGVPRHPVALYEIIFLTACWIGLAKMERVYALKAGVRFKLFMIAYLTFRFVLEFLKPVHTVWLGLSSIQYACLFGLLYYQPTIIRIFSNPINLIHHRHMKGAQ